MHTISKSIRIEICTHKYTALQFAVTVSEAPNRTLLPTGIQKPRAFVSCLDMADSQSTSVKSEDKSRAQREYDPRLDFFSEHFDPLLALITPGVVPPVPNAKVYDNLCKYESIRGAAASSRRQVAPKTNEREGTKRNWLPHQCKCKLRYEVYFLESSMIARCAGLMQTIGAEIGTCNKTS